MLNLSEQLVISKNAYKYCLNCCFLQKKEKVEMQTTNSQLHSLTSLLLENKSILLPKKEMLRKRNEDLIKSCPFNKFFKNR